MKSKKRMKSVTKRHHILLIVILVIVAIFLIYNEIGKEVPQRLVPLKPDKKPEAIPKMAIVIDDLGPNKKIALEVFSIKAPLTLSVFPHEVYTSWITQEGNKLGYEIIGHIPMEAKIPHKLGKGGLYTWMKDEEILGTLDENIASISHIKGISNHMGSAFTEDERAMHALGLGLKKHRLFFLDSITTSRSVSANMAKIEGIKVLQRNVFLDESDNSYDIKVQWEKSIKIAQKRGYIILLAHARKNSIEFLKDAIANTKDVKVVHLSELVTP